MDEQTLKNFLNPPWASKTKFLKLTSPLSVSGDSTSIGVSDRISPEEILQAVLEKKINHVVQKTSMAFDEELNTSALMIHQPQSFFQFPLSSILRANQVDDQSEKQLKSFEFSFTKSSEKVDLLSQMESYLQNFSRSMTFINEACLVVDELFTNAVYNAPFNNVENTSMGMPRNQGVVEMNSEKRGRIFAGHSKNRLVVGCDDPFGTLNAKKLLQRIYKCISHGPENMMRFSEGGAGIGSFMVFMTSLSYYVGVHHNHQTLICVTLPLGLSNREKNEMPKNIHCAEIN